MIFTPLAVLLDSGISYPFKRYTRPLREGDELIEVKQTDENEDIFLVSREGQCIRFKLKDVRETGRVSMGVIGMNLGDTDEVVGMQIYSEGDDLLIVSEKGMGKRTPLDEFTVQHRGGKGLRCYKITEKTGYVIGVKTIKPEEEIMLITTEGIVIRMKSDSISVIGRNTSGAVSFSMTSFSPDTVSSDTSDISSSISSDSSSSWNLTFATLATLISLSASILISLTPEEV